MFHLSKTMRNKSRPLMSASHLNTIKIVFHWCKDNQIGFHDNNGKKVKLLDHSNFTDSVSSTYLNLTYYNLKVAFPLP